MRKPVVAFVHESYSSFVIQDKEILGQIAIVSDPEYKSLSNFARLMVTIARSQVVITWFVSGRATTFSFFASKILGRKIIAIAGGSEVSSNSYIRGKDLRTAIRFFFTKLILRRADFVVGVSNYTMREVLSYSRPQRFRVIHNAVDTNIFSSTHKGNNILTVADWGWSRKGIDRFMDLAKQVPKRNFVLAGRLGSESWVGSRASSNVRITGRLDKAGLIAEFQDAQFYCQLSRHEGFGVAVAEAMSCGCIPIVSDAGALSEVVGDCGFVVPNGDPAIAASIISNSWPRFDLMRSRARERVQTMFSVSKRTAAFSELLSEVMNSRN